MEGLNILTLTRSEIIELSNILEHLSIADQMRLSKIGDFISKICKQNWQSKYFWLWFNFPKLEKYLGFSGVESLLKQNKKKPILHVLFEVDKAQELIDVMSALCENSRNLIMSCEILATQAGKAYAHGPLLELSNILPNVRHLILNIDLTSYFVDCFRNLRKLRLTGKIKPGTLQDILKACVSLRELHLLNDDKTLEFTMEHWPDITCLGLSVPKYINASTDILKLQHITELYIAHDDRTNTADWMECANEVIDARHDRISRIVIGGKSLICSDWLTDIQFDCCLRLRWLVIHNFDFLYAKKELLNLVATTPNLLSLSMLQCDNLTADVFDDIWELAQRQLTVVVDPCPYKNIQQDKMKRRDVGAFLNTYWQLVDGVNFRF